MDEDYEVEFVERGDRKALFLVRGVTPAFANGIRRTMIADVPTLAIDEVRVIENSSVMFDEQIALRLGLVPLTTPPNEFDEDDVVTLSIDVEGPATAYSGDIVSADEMVQPADQNVPIIELKDGQRLELEADAVLGLLTDSNFGGGGTDARGHFVSADYALAPNVGFRLSYFNDVTNEDAVDRGDPGAEELDYDRLILDLRFKY